MPPAVPTISGKSPNISWHEVIAPFNDKQHGIGTTLMGHTNQRLPYDKVEQYIKRRWIIKRV
jgi:hypothetical protein